MWYDIAIEKEIIDMEYSTFCENAVDSITSNAKEYVSLDGKPYSELDRFFGTDFIKDYIDCGNVNKAKTLRSVLRIFGISVNDKKISVAYSQKTTKSVVSQIKPIAKYFSMSFIHRVVAGINAKISKNGGYKSVQPSDRFTKVVSELASKNTLADFLLEQVTENQFVNAPSNGQSVQNCKADDGQKNATTNKEAALKEEVQRLKKQLEKRTVSVGSDELFVERLEESIANVAPSVKFTTEKWRGDSTFKHNHGATEVLHISDWHIGEVDNIGGFNHFNYNIACERVKTLTNKVLSWTKMHRSMYKVDELVILATGDMISGEIHDELRRTNEFPAPEQCVKAALLISKMVNELSSSFKKVRVEYIVHDNHSRTTKKIEFAPGTNSYNYIVGTMAKILLRDNDTVEFNIYPEIQQVVQVEGLRYLITHGNSIRGGFAGIPYYGMNRKLGAEALIRMNMPEEWHFNRIVMGHYHTPFMNNGVEMTGCLSSTTAFDHASGRHSPACQTAWLVSNKFEMDYSIFWLS